MESPCWLGRVPLDVSLCLCPSAEKRRLLTTCSAFPFRFSLQEAIENLVSVGYATAADSGEGADTGRKRQRRSEDGEEEGGDAHGSVCSPSSSGMRKHSLHIEARLHASDFEEVMDKIAPADEVREAWRSGAALPNSKVGNRFKVVVGVEAAEKWSEAVERKTNWTMMEEGREWWEADEADL